MTTSEAQHKCSTSPDSDADHRLMYCKLEVLKVSAKHKKQFSHLMNFMPVSSADASLTAFSIIARQLMCTYLSSLHYKPDRGP